MVIRELIDTTPPEFNAEKPGLWMYLLGTYALMRFCVQYTIEDFKLHRKIARQGGSYTIDSGTGLPMYQPPIQLYKNTHE